MNTTFMVKSKDVSEIISRYKNLLCKTWLQAKTKNGYTTASA